MDQKLCFAEISSSVQVLNTNFSWTEKNQPTISISYNGFCDGSQLSIRRKWIQKKYSDSIGLYSFDTIRDVEKPIVPLFPLFFSL